MPNSNQTFLTYLKATSHTRKFLMKKYQITEGEQAKLLAYENAERFSYGLQLGEEYLKAAAQTPFSVQPLLYYYSLTHYLKSCILVVDHNYPASAKVLAHGLSTRKRKKQHYLFLEDDVRIQPQGLFPFAAKSLFDMTSLPNKVSMNELLKPLPCMKDIYNYKENTSDSHSLFPDLMAMFAVLYNLSMLVRYEGEWWGEMDKLRDREDYVFILHFLESMPTQIANLISSWLEDQSN